ncbi:hypothetical protein JTB14_027213 [Gonioctena quinquepunctata]|nr:hypothetical protein JTB14_027213 [Gonioctena quinquepunctata]
MASTFTTSFNIEPELPSTVTINSVRNQDNLSSIHFPPAKIRGIIEKLKSSSSPGFDGITVLFLRCRENLIHPLSIIMNRSFENSCVPNLSLLLESTCSFYVDDIKIYNDRKSQQVLQNDLIALYNWTCEWLSPLNINKCIVLHLGKDNLRQNYTLNDEQIVKVEYHNDLGVTITSDLTWSHHISNTCKRANTKLYLLKKLFSETSPETFTNIYKAYVRPILEYGGQVWSSKLVRDRKMLESVQHRANRMSFGPRRPPYEDRSNQLGLHIGFIPAYRIHHGSLASLRQINEDTRLR